MFHLRVSFFKKSLVPGYSDDIWATILNFSDERVSKWNLCHKEHVFTRWTFAWKYLKVFAKWKTPITLLNTDRAEIPYDIRMCIRFSQKIHLEMKQKDWEYNYQQGSTKKKKVKITISKSITPLCQQNWNSLAKSSSLQHHDHQICPWKIIIV